MEHWMIAARAVGDGLYFLAAVITLVTSVGGRRGRGGPPDSGAN